MKRSLNEIEHTSRKAAHGCGLPWGVADEVGKAVRWLHVYDIDGVTALVGMLNTLNHFDAAQFAPISLESPWKSTSGILSPALVGPSLCDQLNFLSQSPIKTQKIAFPVLCAGFLGQAALIKDQAVQLQWAGIKLNLYRDALLVDGNKTDLILNQADELSCESKPFPTERTSLKPNIGEVLVTPSTWEELEVFAHLTYVKATEESRLSGAGAGLTDND